jgi:DNA-binding transcriptional ArsR family regulator
VNAEVFAALADPTRMRLLELIGTAAGGCTASSLAGQVPVSRQAVTQHVAVLEASHLVRRRRSGREVLFTVRPDQLMAAASWLSERAGTWRDNLEALKREAEAPQREPGV